MISLFVFGNKYLMHETHAFKSLINTKLIPQYKFKNTRYFSADNVAEDHPVSSPITLSSPFLKNAFARGLIHQCTDYTQLDSLLSKKSVVAYIGFDATAKSLHIGSLIQIMMMRRLQEYGHKPIIVIGGGTTKIGDPSGKDTTRQILSMDTIASNISGISSIFNKYLQIGTCENDALIVNNADWLDSLKYLEFLNDYGRYFTINRMLTFESVKQRLAREQPYTFLEFNYMLLQSYDFLKLHSTHNVELQIGGSDQWGNIVGGVELAHKKAKAQLYGLTTPLLTTADGVKMGKSVGGAVWLDR
jgi:tyrosyl-tRNA synthetase